MTLPGEPGEVTHPSGVTLPHSIAFADPPSEGCSRPADGSRALCDLNLDQIIDLVISGREEYDLRSYLEAPLRRPDDIGHRQHVFRDLGNRALLEAVRSFSQGMQQMRECLADADKLRHRYQHHSLFLEAVGIYGSTLARLADGLAKADMSSPALLTFNEDLTSYLESVEFKSLVADRLGVLEGLAQVQYCVHVKGTRVSVRKYEQESDYSTEVQGVFERFEQGNSKDYRVQVPNRLAMNHVEENILDLVARLYADEFAALDHYCTANQSYLDERVRQFDREIQLYLAYLEFIQPLVSAGLPFCYPEVTRDSKDIFATDTFDLALADKLVKQGSPVVLNEFHLDTPERVLVISGPNQGGKTTLARTFGQLHHLGTVGLLVPGSNARLFLFDQLFTHFPREEVPADLTGKLEDDLIRVRDILNRATPDTIIVINEIFSSTTLNDAIVLGTRVMERIIALDLLAAYVTFVDELSTLSDATVSMVSTIVPGDPAKRTYRVLRLPADGLAYAVALAETYGLTYELLRERIGS